VPSGKPQGRAHWRSLANMIELVLSVVHPSPQRKWQIDWFGRFCIALGRVSSGMPGHILFPNNCPFAWWICTSYLVHNFLGPYKLITQTTSRSVRPFLHSSPPSIPVLYNGTPLFQKNAPFPWGELDLHLIHNCLGPPECSTQTVSWSVQPFCGAHYCDRRTDRLCATWLVTIGHIYIRSTAMRPNITRTK